MPLLRPFEYAAFTLWVSLCAFAPELIWQGFVLLRGHFTMRHAASALFIGALFAFFVEPLVERLKAGRWRLPEEHGHGALLGGLLSVSFGFAVVCLHEAIAAYVGDPHGGDHARRVGLLEALDQALEWASIPAAVTATWFVVGTWRRLAIPAVAAAWVWIIYVGIHYAWGWQVVTTSAIPCCLLVLLGTRIVLRHWDRGTMPELAKLTAVLTFGWLVLAGLVDVILTAIAPELEFYSTEAMGDDLRFYLGWSLGLFVAPNPVSGEQARRLAASE